MSARRHGQFIREFFGVAIAWIIMVPLFQPILRFVPPMLIAMMGVMAGATAWGVYDRLVMRRGDTISIYVPFFLTLIGLFCVMTFGSDASSQTARRCAWLQTRFVDQRQPDMDAVAIYSALGCQPQFPGAARRMFWPF